MSYLQIKNSRSIFETFLNALDLVLCCDNDIPAQVGGKNVSDNMVAKVSTFVDELLKRTAEMGYSRHVGIFDQNFRQKNK